MSREKQIEGMALVIASGKGNNSCKNCEECVCHDIDCIYKNIADILYNAGYRKQELISVEERLPDESGNYLTYHEHGSCGVIYYNASIKLWNVYYSDDVRCAIRSVTHWMPLPEPPKGE